MPLKSLYDLTGHTFLGRQVDQIVKLVESRYGRAGVQLLAQRAQRRMMDLDVRPSKPTRGGDSDTGEEEGTRRVRPFSFPPFTDVSRSRRSRKD